MPMDFKKEVVDLSFVKPVLVDFWAAWCGPCKMLGPILEDLELASNGKWALVKIDTEAEQDIAAYFRIQSIPHCKLIHEGKIIDEFSGALSREAVKQWLDERLSNIVVEEAETVSDNFEDLLALQNKIPDQFLLEKILIFIEDNPDHDLAQHTAAKHEVFYRPDSAIARLNLVQDAKLKGSLAEDLLVIKEFLDADLKESDPADQLLIKAGAALVQGDEESLMDSIIESIIKHPKHRDGLARRTGIALFHIWGNLYPTTQEYRRSFDMAIY